MLKDLLVVAGNVATLFLMMAVGYLFGKKGMLSGETQGQLSSLLLKVVAPCIMIGSLQVDYSAELLRNMLLALGALAGTYALYGIGVRFLFCRQEGNTRASLRFGVMFGNVGFMGLPLISSVLGSEALVFCTMSLVVFNTANWTYGTVLMGDRVSLRRVLVNPGVVGMVIGISLFLLRIRLPGPVLSAVNYLGDLNTPLAMVVIGAQMAGADIPATFREKRLYLSAALKLLVMPLVTLAVLLPFGLDRMALMTIVILSACPTAGATCMFAQMFGKDTTTAARMVTLSTLLSVLTLPIVALIARQVGG